jgi:hypothetical protein
MPENARQPANSRCSTLSITVRRAGTNRTGAVVGWTVPIPLPLPCRSTDADGNAESLFHSKGLYRISVSP